MQLATVSDSTDKPLPISQQEKAQFRAKLMMQGKTIAQWCQENNHDTPAIYRALRGLDKGYYGTAFHSVTAIRTFLFQSAPDLNSHEL